MIVDAGSRGESSLYSKALAFYRSHHRGGEEMKLSLLVLLAATATVAANKPEIAAVLEAKPEGPVVLFEPFRDGWNTKWVNSSDARYDGKWVWSKDYSEITGDHGLMMSSAGKLHAMAVPIEGGLEFKKDTIVVQYEVKAANGLACDGQYLKLLQTVKGSLNKFNNDARYTIMFGPDKCSGTDKVHFIVQYQNPVTKEWEEKHAGGVPLVVGSDKQTHIYTLILRPDNSFEILVDLESKKKGNLLNDMSPAINPPKEIDDPSDSKPSDWVDDEMMDDPHATKPDDWDENAPHTIEDMDAVKPAAWEDDEPDQIPDPKAKRPSDWDDDEDGDWEAPLVPNPKCKAAGCGVWKRPLKANPDYKGKWYPARISNPAYKGEWVPRQIPNKAFFEESNPFSKLAPISAVAIELLSISGGITFDNILITNSETQASEFAKLTWAARHKVEVVQSGASGDFMGNINNMVERNSKLAMTAYAQHPVPFIIGVVLFFAIVIGYIVICIGDARESARKPPRSAAKKQDITGADDDEEDSADDDDDDDDENDEPAPAAGASARKRASRKD